MGKYKTICLNTQKLWQVLKEIFMAVRKKLYKQLCTKHEKKYVIRDGFWQTCTNWKPQSNDISISSAIWQVLLVSDSLWDSACVKGAHRHKFKHQMCCPWKLGNREHLIRMKYATQPSPVVPTKVVPLASPAILNTGPPSEAMLDAIQLTT